MLTHRVQGGLAVLESMKQQSPTARRLRAPQVLEERARAAAAAQQALLTGFWQDSPQDQGATWLEDDCRVPLTVEPIVCTNSTEMGKTKEAGQWGKVKVGKGKV